MSYQIAINALLDNERNYLDAHKDPALWNLNTALLNIVRGLEEDHNLLRRDLANLGHQIEAAARSR